MLEWRSTQSEHRIELKMTSNRRSNQNIKYRMWLKSSKGKIEESPVGNPECGSAQPSLIDAFDIEWHFMSDDTNKIYNWLTNLV